MAWTKWDEEQEKRRQNNPLAAALKYSYQMQEQRRQEREREQAEKAAAAQQTAGTQKAPETRTEADRMAANQRLVDLRRRSEATRQRTQRATVGKLQPARLAADQAAARWEQMERAAKATGSTFSRVDDMSGRERLKPMKGAAYVFKRFAQGAGDTLAGVEDLARAGSGAMIQRAAARSTAPQEPTVKNLALQMLRGLVGEKLSAAQDLLTTGWDKQLGEGDNLARLATTAGDAAIRMATPMPVDMIKDELLQILLLSQAARTGKTGKEAGQDLARRMMETPNGVRQLTNLDAFSAKLDAQAVTQRRGVRTAGEISHAIGGMTPAIALSVISGNGNAGVMLMAAGAGGEKVRTAWEATGDVEKAWKAGLGTAMKEAATEKLFTFAGGILGKGVMDKATRKLVGERGVARYLANALGEGAEEVLSSWWDSYVDRGTWDSEAQRVTFRELLQAGALGTAVSLILGVPVAFSGGKMTVSDSDKLSEAQTRQIDDAAARARERMAEIEDRVQSLQGEVAEWTQRNDQERADTVRAEIRKADEAYRQAMADAGIDASKLFRPAAAQPAQTAAAQAPTVETPGKADAAALLRTAEEEAEDRAAKLRDAGYKAKGVYMDAQEDLETAKTKLEEARKEGDAEKTAAAEQKVAEAEARLAEAKTAWEAARDAATAPMPEVKAADQAAKVDATTILPGGQSSKRPGRTKGALLESRETEEPLTRNDLSDLPGVQAMLDSVQRGEDAAGKVRLDSKVATSLTDKGVGRFKDLLRNLKAATGKAEVWDEATRRKKKGEKAKGDAWKEAGEEQAAVNARELHEKIVKPLFAAKAKYATGAKEQLQKVADMCKKYGIKKGSKESAAAQWYGEGYWQDELDERHPYGEEDLRKEFGEERAKDIMGFVEEARGVYDEYISRVNRMLERIFPDPLGQAQIAVERAKGMVEWWKSKLSEAAATGDPAKVADVRTRITDAEIELARLIDSINSGAYLEGKRLIPRRNYFRHLREIGGNSIGAMIRRLEGNQAIDPLLVGVSENTKPKKKFWGALLHQGHGPYVADAVAGLQDYIPAAEYKIAFDPFIADMRGIILGLARDTRKIKNANDLIQWLTDWTNDLAGKTNTLDRVVAQGAKGRKRMAILKETSQRIRGNMVTMNGRSALAQASNIGNATKYIANPVDWAKAIPTTFSNTAGRILDFCSELFKVDTSGLKPAETEVSRAMKESALLAERYLDKDISKLDSGVFSSLEKLSAAMLRALDQLSAELIWGAAYNQGKRLGIAEGSLVQYADETTLKSTAGRGAGEAPLAMKSEIMKLIHPFMLEANNAIQAGVEMAKDGRFLRILLSMGVDWLANEILRELFGFEVTWDPIEAAIDAVKERIDLPEEERTVWALVSQIGRNELGELASNVPLGPRIVQEVFPEEADRKAIFGDRDPLQYGTQNVAINLLTAPIADLVRGRDVSDDLLSLTLMTVPRVGGKAAERAIGEVKRRTGFDPVLQFRKGEKVFDIPARAPGTSYDKRGNVRYVQDTDRWNIFRGATFGEWTTDAGKAYLESGSKSLSEANSRDYERLVEAGLTPQQAWDVVQGILDSKARKDRDGMIYFTQEKWWPGFQRMDSVQKEIAAEMALRAISDERLEKAQAAKTECWVSLADALEYGETGNAKEALAWLEQSGLSASQKEWLYNNPISGQERSGSYAQWAAAKRELEGNKRYQRLSPEDKDALLKKCLDYKPGDAAKADAAVVAGWKLSEYYLYAELTSRLHADKDEKGKTISGSAKDKKIYMMEHSGLSKGKQALFLLLSEGYKLDAEMMAAANEELAKQNLSYAELKEIAEACGCKLANGKLVR